MVRHVIAARRFARLFDIAPTTTPSALELGEQSPQPVVEVLALGEEDGEIKWRARVSSEVLSSPEARGGVAVTRTIDGKLFGLSTDDGTRGHHGLVTELLSDELKAAGQAAADRFLSEHKDCLGVRPSVDLAAMFG